MNKILYIIHAVIGKFPNQTHITEGIRAWERAEAKRHFRDMYPGAVIIQIETA